MRKSTTTNIDRLAFLGYSNAYEVTKAISDVSAREGMPARFNEIAYEIRLNPSLLAVLLERGIAAGLIDKKKDVGYTLTELGARVLGHATSILEA